MHSITDLNRSFIVLLMISRTIAEVELSPYASWDQNGVTVAGASNGTNGSSLNELSLPISISITSNDILYISDSDNNRIVLVDLTTPANPTTIGSGPGSNASQLNVPMGLVTTNTSVFVIDINNNRIKKTLLDGSNPSTALNFSGPITFYFLYVDNDDNIYLSDYLNGAILLFLSNSTNGTVVAGTGVPGARYDQLNRPYGVFVNRNGTMYIADRWNNRIMKWLSGTTVGMIVAGNGSAGAASTQLNYPANVVVDTNEYLYIVESYNSRVTRWAPNSTFGVCIAACTGALGIATNQLNKPHSLAFDSNGSLYVADRTNNRIQKFQMIQYRNAPTTSQNVLASQSRMVVENSTGAVQPTTSFIFTTETSANTISYHNGGHASIFFLPPRCQTPAYIGMNCNTSALSCDLLQPCQNNGTCINNDTTLQTYTCSCLPAFHGTNCEADTRPCQSDTCWNSGTCSAMSNTAFLCRCAPGWLDDRCQTKINYCKSDTCLNNGVCQPLLLNYTCQCLDGSYSGRRCEIIANRLVVYQTIAKSFAYVAIIAMIAVAMFVIVLDVLSYWCGIDPARRELQLIRLKKVKRRKKPVKIVRYIYIPAPPQQLPKKTTSTVEEATV